MNFKHMPELDWTWGYYSVWGIMIIIVAGMLAFFRYKKWF
jgi:magnesium transporter